MSTRLPVVLAIDTGTQLGWAIRDHLGLLHSGTLNLRGGRYEGGGARFLRFRKWLQKMWEDAGPWNEVYYEEVRRHLGVDAAHCYGGLVATLTAFCESIPVPYSAIPVATIKKTATGKGNANKDVVMAAALERWPDQNIRDNNMADALWILETALTQAV